MPARWLNATVPANVLFTYELARKLEATSVTANALHPGVVSYRSGPRTPPAASGSSSRSCGPS